MFQNISKEVLVAASNNQAKMALKIAFKEEDSYAPSLLVGRAKEHWACEIQQCLRFHIWSIMALYYKMRQALHMIKLY